MKSDNNNTKDSKRNKFISIGNKRINNAIKSINLLGNLSNKSTYEYSKDDTNKIFRTLKKTINDVETQFINGNKISKKSLQILN